MLLIIRTIYAVRVEEWALLYSHVALLVDSNTALEGSNLMHGSLIPILVVMIENSVPSSPRLG